MSSRLSEERSAPRWSLAAASAAHVAHAAARLLPRRRPDACSTALVPDRASSRWCSSRGTPATNFIFDEQEALLANPYVRTVADPRPKFGWLDAFHRDFWGLPPDRSIGSYRPMPDLVWRALWELGAREQTPFLHHWVNVLLHGVNGALVVAARVQRMDARSADGVARRRSLRRDRGRHRGGERRRRDRRRARRDRRAPRAARARAAAPCDAARRSSARRSSASTRRRARSASCRSCRSPRS